MRRTDIGRPSLADAMKPQEIEDNPLTPAEVRMFEMFEREGWSFDRRREYILAQIMSPATE